MFGISYKVRGLPEVEAFLKSLPRGVMKVALGAIATYLIGDERHGLRHEPNYKYVSRESAYGQTFVSDRQRRYVMAAIREGTIKPGQDNRRGVTSASWGYTEVRGGYGISILNPTQGAYFTQDDRGQARQPAKVGWRKTAVTIASNMSGAMRSALAEVRKYLAKKG